MGEMVKNEITVGKFTLLGSTFNSTSIDFIQSIDSFDAASTTINFTKNTMYFDGNVLTGFAGATTTSVTST